MIAAALGLSAILTRGTEKVTPDVALYRAISSLDARAARQAVRDGAGLRKAAKGYDEPPLFYALERPGMFEVVRRLGAPIDGVDAHGRTLLHFLVSDPWLLPSYPTKNPKECHIRVAIGPMPSFGRWAWREKLATDLLRHGVELEARDDLGRSALHYAVLGSWRGVDLLLRLRSREESVFTLERDRALHAFLDAQDAGGETALILLAKGPSDRSDRVENEVIAAAMLLEAEAKIDLRDLSGRTAESWAVKNGDHVLAALFKAKREENTGP